MCEVQASSKAKDSYIDCSLVTGIKTRTQDQKTLVLVRYIASVYFILFSIRIACRTLAHARGTLIIIIIITIIDLSHTHKKTSRRISIIVIARNKNDDAFQSLLSIALYECVHVSVAYPLA